MKEIDSPSERTFRLIQKNIIIVSFPEKHYAEGEQFQQIDARRAAHGSRVRFDRASGSRSHRPDAAVQFVLRLLQRIRQDERACAD